ncbi:hypothetical protein [Fredinandcohnia onubensis]|uniref:hypothetical protein n=1 Tax=Fredinandcohnia onubensis TaxID=1571209 RepID=UPI000C0BC52B|nr:hypothetical protein [Fredinandcohnia onubensis]
MKETILIIAEIVNLLHDIIIDITNQFGLNISDKDLHLWVIGILGIITFFIVQVIFKLLAKWSITAISFVYTFTVLIVVVFAIEIQQKITGRGNMEFLDAVIGLWGFLIFFMIYLFLRLIVFAIKKLGLFLKNKRKH